jgi:hypothetical protein
MAASGTGGTSSATNPAVPASALQELQAATQELNTAVGELTGQTGANNDGGNIEMGQRRKIIDAATRILDAAKDPTDQWMDLTAQIALVAANRLFWLWKVFDNIPAQGSISYVDLAAKVDVETGLLRGF